MNIRICLVLIFILSYFKEINAAKRRKADVLILGAGLAGVTAAKTLAENGVDSFLILEATDRVGGRVKEDVIGTTTVQTGAGWVSGTIGNPIFDLAVKNNVKWVKNDYDDWVIIDDRGNDVTSKANPVSRKMSKAFNFALNLRSTFLSIPNHTDYTISSAMAMGGWIPKDAIDDVVEYFDIDFCTALPGDLTSITYFHGTNPVFPYRDDERFVLNGKKGFSEIARSILNDVPDWQKKLHLNTVVKSIKYKNDSVVVSTSQGKFTGKYAIVTFSIGVLQNKAVRFVPPLPTWKTEAIFGFNYVTYSHLYLRFPADIEWFVPENTEWILFASKRRGYFPVWQNFEKHIPGSRILHGTVTYEESERLHRMTDDEIMTEAMVVLRILFGSNIPDAEEILFERWLTNPFYYGSYSCWPPGFNLRSFSDLKAPVGRLYFAGEAYHNDFGFTSGAYLAGKREATKLAECILNKEGCVKS